MPELPDVEVFRRYLESTALHTPITKVDYVSRRLLEGVSRSDLISGLKERSLQSAERHGKYLFAALEPGAGAPELLLHFGMTGSLSYYKGTDDPKYAQLVLRFSDGYSLSYINKRMLGRIGLVESRTAYVREKELGPDALSLDGKQFDRIARGGRGSIKTTLMNQKRIAGLGNVYVDEILHAAGIAPKRCCGELSDDEVTRLYSEMHRIIDIAVEARARPEEMPKELLLRRRKAGRDCPRCGGSVKKTTIRGRSTYYCPACQT